jgi:uncharacterized membrane protein
MHEWLIVATNVSVAAIQWVALITIVLGAAEAALRGVLGMISSSDGHKRPDAWLRLGRWLVAGLTFQLAADILETAITTSWEEVGRLAALAAIRTALNYFLERDLNAFERRQGGPIE